MAMLKMRDGRIENLSVADPSRKLSRIALTVSGIYGSESEGFRTIPDEGAEETLLLIDLPQGVYAGKSVTLEV